MTGSWIQGFNGIVALEEHSGLGLREPEVEVLPAHLTKNAAPYDGPGGSFPISTDGGMNPRWSSSGRELFYLNGGKVMSVDVQTVTGFHAGIPKMMFERNPPPADYDVSPDGKRFLMLKQEAPRQGPPNQMKVVVNWFEELCRLAPMVK